MRTRLRSDSRSAGAGRSSCCGSIEAQFDVERVRGELEAYRRKGPHKTTRLMIEELTGRGVDGLSVLDIGGGVGALIAGLIEAGIDRAIHLEISSAYSEAASEVARDRGYSDRLETRVGDIVAMTSELPQVDVVTLDRVICCYPDMPALVRASAPRARSLLAVSYPRDGWPVHAATGFKNARRSRKGNDFRTYLFPHADIDREIRSTGFELAWAHGILAWRIALYERPDSASIQ